MAAKKASEKQTAKLRKSVEYQVACEERAHRIVERFIENPVTPDHFINSLQYITQSHYSDIVEERAVSNLCGYPLCPNDLGTVLKQKYLISTMTNKVYDIKSRKNFCRARCHKASQHLERQVPNDPVWSRKNLPPTKIDLLPLDMKIGKIGDEVLINTSEVIRDDLIKLERQEKYHSDLAERIHKQNTGGLEGSSVQDGEEVDKSSGMEREQVHVGSDASCVYSLGKTLNELKIERNDNDKTGEKQNKIDIVGSGDGEDTVKETCAILSGKSSESESCQPEQMKSGDSKSCKRSKRTIPSQSKTDYLMQLLDKRKALLANMADIQNDIKVGDNVAESTNKVLEVDTKQRDDEPTKENYITIQESIENLKQRNGEPIGDNNNPVTSNAVKVFQISSKEIYAVHDEAKEDEKRETDCKPRKESCIFIAESTYKDNVPRENNEQSDYKPRKVYDNIVAGNVNVADDMDEVEKYDTVTTSATVKSSEQSVLNTEEKTYSKSVAEKRREKVLAKKCNKQAECGIKQKKAISTIEMICRGVESWITAKTVEYLRVDNRDVETPVDGKTNFDKQYQDLVAKVDAQERDFDGLLGKEFLEPDFADELPKAPHFEFLRDEVEMNQIRVREFMKGSFTYKVTEKQTDNKEAEGASIVLPTVDKYDQMVIRRKIVLERINKVLSDVLSPLHLLVQDVFTELRELICTFNLTSDNIMLRPTEWTLVTLVLLRMLARKMHVVRQSFKSPAAEKYFTVLLSGLRANIDTVDNIVDNLLKV